MDDVMSGNSAKWPVRLQHLADLYGLFAKKARIMRATEQ
jgi:hypothetical protein